MGKLLEHDAEIRRSVLDIYDSVVSMLEMENFEKNLRKELATKYGEYNKIVASNMNHLRRKHCPIVVAGKATNWLVLWLIVWLLFKFYCLIFNHCSIIFQRRDKFRKVIFAKPFHWGKGATWTFTDFHRLYLPNIQQCRKESNCNKGKRVSDYYKRSHRWEVKGIRLRRKGWSK